MADEINHPGFGPNYIEQTELDREANRRPASGKKTKVRGTKRYYICNLGEIGKGGNDNLGGNGNFASQHMSFVESSDNALMLGAVGIVMKKVVQGR